MIRRAIIKNYRMLRANDVALPPFVVLVGKNATGKSTFLGALRFVSDLLRGGVDQALEGALEHEAPNFLELCFDPRLPIEIAVEVDVDGRPARYEVQVGPDPSAGIAVLREQLYLLPEPGLALLPEPEVDQFARARGGSLEAGCNSVALASLAL